MIINLLSNAVKFTDEGEVAMFVSGHLQPSDAGKVCALEITVRDTGIGILKEQQPRIFDAFEQADGSIEREYGGTGLGLSICKQLVELMGGTIGVESEPGKGSRFEFSIRLELGEQGQKVDPAQQLVPVVFLAALVVLDDARHGLLDPLAGREALAAFVAFPTATDLGSFASQARVDDAIAVIAAVGTLLASAAPLVEFADPGRADGTIVEFRKHSRSP